MHDVMGNHLMSVSINGVAGDGISALDRGLSFGDGLFETCRLVDGKIPLLKWHLERLLSGCKRLKIVFTENDFHQYLEQHFCHDVTARVGVKTCKITITRGVGGRGYQLPSSTQTNCIIGVFDFPYTVPVIPVELMCCQQTIARSAMLSGLKHLNRLENVLLKQECIDAGFDDGLVFDEKDNLIETTGANVFLLKDRVLTTPDLSYAGVAGVARRLVMEQLAKPIGLKITVTNISRTQLINSDGVFICNALMGIAAVKRIIMGADNVVKYNRNHTIDKLQALFEKVYQK